MDDRNIVVIETQDDMASIELDIKIIKQNI